MDTKEFLDVLYAGWSKTTGAENRYYVVELDPEPYEEICPPWGVYAVAQDESREWVASFANEHDADWFASLHGAFADLVRQVHTSLDEAERLDVERDELVCRIAVLEMEAEQLEEYKHKYEGLCQ